MSIDAYSVHSTGGGILEMSLAIYQTSQVRFDATLYDSLSVTGILWGIWFPTLIKN